ncbi:MAG: type toxin-antitoxin system VapC family toxin [Flaviaesturariibacter sp.]|nr:type toxin-antitoxin system VapC family toxin [Flaviaesturariibacter sp.]
MNGGNYLVDTNILLYIVSGHQTLTEYLQKRSLFISVISEIEFLGYKNLSASIDKSFRNFLKEFRVIYLDEIIKEEAINIRKQYNLKLPDAIVAATAISLDLPFISADKQFRQIKSLPLEVYEP